MIQRTLTALLLLAFCHAGFSQTPTSSSSCFSGHYKSLSAFTAHTDSLRKKRGQGALTPEVEQAIKRDYNSWQQIEQNHVSCRFFEYQVDGIPVTGFVLQPRNIEVKQLEPLIFNRGGNADLVMSTRYIFGRLVPIAREGFLIIGSFYRGAQINGQPSEHRLRDEFGGQDVRDVLALLPIVDNFEGMKNKKVAMWGMSRGGMMAFLAAKQSDRFSTIIADSAPVDMVAEAKMTDRMEKVFRTWIPNYEKNREQSLKDRSVIYWHQQLNKIPILLLHGENDWRVRPENTLLFALALQRAEHPYELHIYKGAHHGLRAVESEVNEVIVRWVRMHANG